MGREAAESRVQRLTQERDRWRRKVALLRAFPSSGRQYETELMAAQMAATNAEREMSRALRSLRAAPVEEMV